MTTFATTTIDRRAAYYARLTADRHFDPLSLYVRAEKGRRWLLTRFTPAAACTASLPSGVQAVSGTSNVLRIRRRA